MGEGLGGNGVNGAGVGYTMALLVLMSAPITGKAANAHAPNTMMPRIVMMISGTWGIRSLYRPAYTRA